jgi:thiamine-monophosphate kinase
MALDTAAATAGRSRMKVDEIGEFGLIERIRARKTSYDEDVIIGIGDDCAILRRGQVLEVLTTDCLVEGTHYQRGWLSMRDIGWTALGVNASDVAAVGGTPRHALVTLFLPEETGTSDVDELYDGLEECGAATGASVVGGDIVKIHGPFAVSVTLSGTCERDEVVLRSGARKDDIVVVTGSLGEAALGLRLLRERGAAAGGGPGEGNAGICVADGPAVAAALGKFRRPLPRLSASRAIVQELRPSSMIDISDGLVSDMWHVLESSKVGAVLDEDAVPIAPSVIEHFGGRTEEALSMAIAGGEEYELLFTMSGRLESRLPELADKLGIGLTRIGKIVAKASGAKLAGAGGEKDLKPGGFDHFKSEGPR